MTTSTWSNDMVISNNTTNFRVFGKAISDALTAVGLTKVTDSGQINWATVNVPAASTSAGYEVRYLDDAQHSNTPIYIKIEYGCGGNTSRWGIWLTLGTTQDGAGTIGGTSILVRTIINPTADTTSVSCTGFACFSGGQFNFVQGVATQCLSFGVNRTCDTDGTMNSQGAHVWYQGTTGPAGAMGTVHISYRRTPTVVVTNNGTQGGFTFGPSFAVMNSGTYNNSTDVYTFPTYLWTDKPVPIPGLIGIGSTDYVYGTSFTVTTFGTSRTYMPMLGASRPRRFRTGADDGGTPPDACAFLYQ